MAFRDHLTDVTIHPESISCVHGLLNHSISIDHQPFIASNISEAPGHSAAINILSRERLCAALNIDAGELIDILGSSMENPSEPIIVEDGPVLECSHANPKLGELPIPWHYSEDRGRYMSASIVIAEYEGIRNVSFHRQFLRDDNHVVARLVPRHLRSMVDSARSNGDEVPIAIVNGADPVVLLAAAMSFNEPLDELSVASTLHERFYGSKLELITLDNGISVPADCEYAMEAAITCSDDAEGPYVDITGTLDEIRSEPVFRIDTIHHRNGPIFHALIPALSEHITLMGLPRAPTIKSAVSAVTKCNDVWLSEGGCGWLSAVISITPTSENDGRKAIEAAFEGHKSMKMVTVVDSDIDVSNATRVEWAMMTRWQPDTDTIILSGQKGSSLDPSQVNGLTAKIGFDATLTPLIDRSPFTSVI